MNLHLDLHLFPHIFATILTICDLNNVLVAITTADDDNNQENPTAISNMNKQ